MGDFLFREEVVLTENTGVEWRLLSDVAGVLSSSLNAEELVSAFARKVVERFGTWCAVVYNEGEGHRLGSFAHRDPSFVLPASVLPASGGPLRHIVAAREPVLRSVVEEDDVCSFISVPIVLTNRMLGAICIASSDPSRRFQAVDLEIATAAARQLAVALENSRSFERFRLLGRATEQLFSHWDSKQKLRRLLEVIVAEVADWAVIYVLGAGGTIRVQDVLHREPDLMERLSEIRGQRVFNAQSERVFTEQLLNHRTMFRPKAGIERLRETLLPYMVPIYAAATPQSMLTVPLFTSEEVFGALSIYAEHRSFAEGEVELMQEIGRRVALAFEHDESIERERRLTRTLQEVTLPAQLPSIPNVAVSTVYTPAATSDAQLGGDWYDIFALPGGRFLLSIGDVTGRGLQASAIMGKLRHSINVVAMYEEDPARILDAAEWVVRQRYPDAIATTFVAIYDRESSSLVYANAGHPFPLLRLRDRSLEELSAGGLPIGLRNLDKPARSHSRTLHDVEVLAFYTDGIVEAERDASEGERKLKAAVQTAALPFIRSPAALLASTCLPPQSHDDAALLVLVFPNGTTWVFQADHAKAATDARWAFVNQLRREGVVQERIDVAEIIFGELVANVVRHAPGPIDIALEWHDGQGILHVTDRGRGFARKPRRSGDLLDEAGRGLWLVEQFGGSIDVEAIPGFGTHVRVALPVRRAEPAPARELARH